MHVVIVRLWVKPKKQKTKNNKIEFKRTDSASLTNYSKTNGDGAGGDGLNNDDTFYSPIGKAKFHILAQNWRSKMYLKLTQ